MVKYEHDVITSDSDVITPDSQMHVTSTAHSPYGDFATEVRLLYFGYDEMKSINK